MKILLGVLIWLTVFVGFYLMLSAIGLILCDYSYKQILHNQNWISVYVVFGWIIPTVVTFEWDLNNHFKDS